MAESVAADITRADLGAFLREKREAQGLQLEDVARITRISKNYLIAIEEGMFDKLPNPAYVKGFLRLYAGVVGLSGDEVVAAYEKNGIPTSPQAAEPQPRKPASRPDKGTTVQRGRWLLPIFLLFLVIVVFLLQGKEEKKAVPPSAPAKPPVAAVPPPVQPVVSSARPAAVPAAPPSAAAPPAAAAPATTDSTIPEPATKGVILKLKFNQDSSLNITIDNSLSQHYELKAGDLIEWKGERSFTIDVGNAGAVEGEFNGKPLKPFGALGVSAHVVLKADGAQ